MPIHADLLYILLCAIPCGLGAIVISVWYYIEHNVPEAYEDDETGFNLGPRQK